MLHLLPQHGDHPECLHGGPQDVEAPHHNHQTDRHWTESTASTYWGKLIDEDPVLVMHVVSRAPNDPP